ncbi:hypothetical protein ACQ4PT_044915 [Festuca glaucescens]
MGAVERPEPAQRSAPMRLCVHVLEARGLSAIYLNGSSDPYVRLQLGRRRAKTTVVKRSLSPAWDEEFGFLVADVAEDLVVSVLNEDRYFSTDFLGRVRVPLAAILETEDHSLGTAWYQLQPKSSKSRRKKRDEITEHWVRIVNLSYQIEHGMLVSGRRNAPCAAQIGHRDL